MNDISTLLNQILEAKHGEQVRQSIHDSIEQCYEDVNNPSLREESFYNAVQQAIEDGTLDSLAIEDGSITASKIAEGAVGELAIANWAITNNKLDEKVVTSDKIADNAVENRTIKNYSVTSDKIYNHAITSEKLASNSVITSKIADEAVTREKIANGSITPEKIAFDSITGDKLRDNSITNNKLASSSVDSRVLNGYAVAAKHIQPNAVTTEKLQNGSVTTEKLANSSVDNTKIAFNTIKSENIQDGAITPSKIANGSLPVSKLILNSISDLYLADNAVTSRIIKNGAVTTDKIDDSAVTTDKIANLNVTSEKIESEAITTDKIKNYSVTAQKLSQSLYNLLTGASESVSELKAEVANINNTLAEVDNELASLRQTDIRHDLEFASKVDDAYVQDGYLYMTGNGEILIGPLGPFSGGGGGGDTNHAKLTVTNNTGWLSTTVAQDADCEIRLNWSSIEDEMPTGNGSVKVTSNNVFKTSYEVAQGDVTINLKEYLSTGLNVVKVQISDVYGNARTISFNVTVVALYITSSFDVSSPFTSAIAFPYTPVGAVAKTVHFILDGTEIGTQQTSVSNRQMTYSIPQQSHGAHTLRVYFESEINGETVRSNELYFEFIALEPMNNTVIITSSFNKTKVTQYESIIFPYFVYDPKGLTAEVELYANNVKVADLTVDRSEQSYTYRASDYGTLNFKIKSGTTEKVITVTVEELDIDVEAETRDLKLYLSSQGRSNQEANPATWTYQSIETEFNGFNWSSDGWQTDEDGIVALRILGGGTIEIPYKPFASDFRQTGKTIELEFATRNVLDYDTPILTCMSGGRGLSLTAQRATLKSEQSEISTQYKEEDHIRVAFVAEKRSEDRLLFVYINAVPSGVIQYPDNDDFAQTEPVNISIGSNDCTIDLYCIRVYDNDLTRNQVLDNWIADTPDGATMLERYVRNNVYDAYCKIVVDNLPSSLPYFILNAEELPQYKGDKKTITGQYVDPMYPSKSFTFTGCQINVQGTSSAPYARKNYDMQFKKGFELSSGHADSYALRTGAIPFNRFVLKADVASSEGANNVELVRLYNDACPYKTPEMRADSRVRWGIDGFPIVVFWNDTATNTVSFLGKYNFNLPKRAPAPYGYANAGNMESWEFENNTSNLLLFKSDYFDMNTYVDDEGNVLPNWRKDFEARFPSDAWLNIDILQEFVSFVVSTDRAQATGDPFPEAVTYENVEYTADTAEYRLAKFKAEFPTYAELDTFLFYYIFTELFLMVDSRAKNLFIGFNGSDVAAQGRVATRKATAQPYDMDTGLGTNNEGSLVFGYSLEDTDHLSGGADIFNGQQSVLWNNVRDAYPAEIVRMYQTLRSNGVLSYDTVEQRYEEHQSKWPEAIWIEDAWFKYIDPLINPDPGKEATAVYLPMMQGSKEEQRKWWLINRFRYMDSKWNAGDALSQVIQLRGYAKANITVTPYADIYPAVRYASYLVRERGRREQPTTLVCPIDELNDTEIYIYSAPQLADVGDLAPLKVGFADFSLATNLQAVKIGDADESYSNTNLYSLSLGSNRLLKTLDVRNCSGLGDTSLEGHTQTTVDISGCSVIEEIYFDGTNITGLQLPNGGIIKKLHLPETVTNLTVMNQKSVTEFVIPTYQNISTLRLENVSDAIDQIEILKQIPANSRVRLIGFYLLADDAQEIDQIFDILDTMRGLDEQGNNMDTAQVSGEIHTASLTGAEIAEFNARYPYVRVTADHTSAVLTYKTYDGASTLYTETVLDGGNGTKVNSTARTADAQYSYTADGWATEANGNKDANALVNVVADRTVYAAYTKTLRKYTVSFVRASDDGGGTLQTLSNVSYGTVITASSAYTGATPTTTKGDATDYPFEGWSPASATVTGNMTFTAKFSSPTTAPTATTADGAYGVEWDYSQSSPALTRKGLASAFADPSPATSVSGTGSSPFDSILPWSGMKRYNVINGEISYSEDDARFDETLYDTVVYIPEFYYTAYKDTDNSKWLWAVSPTELEGYVKHPGSGRYVGRFHTSGDSTEVFTKSGVMPLVNTSQTDFRTYSHNKGSKWYMLDFATWSAIQMLYLVEYANFYSQDKLGTGWNTGSAGTMGGTTGAAYHTLKVSGAHNQYRWIEDPFSNVMDNIDGFVASSRTVYAGVSDTGYTESISGLQNAGITLPSSNYATGLGYSDQAAWAFIPDTASGGSGTTYLTDRVYSNAGTRVARVGGGYSSYDDYGMFYLAASGNASSTDGCYGSRLLLIP